MFKNWSILLACTMLVVVAYPQNNPVDSTIKPTKQDISADTSILDYDALFRDFDSFMDSLLMPRNYFLTSLSMGKGYYNFQSKSYFIETAKKLTYSPTLGYYHKSGLGITGTGYIVHDNENMNFYQYAITPSFDYLQNREFGFGLAFTKFFTKDSLPFYTTPLQNEMYGYVTVRKWWVRPTVSASYGWGSRTDYKEREVLIQDLRLRRNGFTYINTKESISDFSLVAAIRHDFYWLDVFTFKDHIRFTPQVSFTSGTQKFGFNQSSASYGILRTATNTTGNSILFSSENVYLDDELRFQPLSLTTYLRGEYSIGKFFVQPQFAVDYYFPAEKKNLSTLFSVNLGVVF